MVKPHVIIWSCLCARYREPHRLLPCEAATYHDDPGMAGSAKVWDGPMGQPWVPRL